MAAVAAVLGVAAGAGAGAGAGAAPRVVTPADLAGHALDPRWSHDGRRLSYEVFYPARRHRSLFVADAATLEPRRVVADTGADAGDGSGTDPLTRELAWHPQGRAYVYGAAVPGQRLELLMEGGGVPHLPRRRRGGR